MGQRMLIRNVRIEDLDRCSQIELEGFPPAEAADRDSYKWRIENIPEWFFVAEEDGIIKGQIVRRPTELDVFADELYEPFELKPGAFNGILSLVTGREYLRQGVAAELMKYTIDKCREAGFRGVTLACKEELVHYYAKFGFELVGKSESEHGGALWYDMRLVYTED